MHHAVYAALTPAPPKPIQCRRDAPLIGRTEFRRLDVQGVARHLKNSHVALRAGDRPVGDGVLPRVGLVPGRLLGAGCARPRTPRRATTSHPAETGEPPQRTAWSRSRANLAVSICPTLTGQNLRAPSRRGDTPPCSSCRKKRFCRGSRTSRRPVLRGEAFLLPGDE